MYKLTKTNSVIRLSDNAWIPADQENIDWLAYQSWLAGGNEPLPADPPTIDDFTHAVQAHLDGFARTRNYDGILSAATYATSTVPKFQAEGQYAVEARDATWAKCYEILAAVEGGTRPMPTMGELIAELPVLTWPN